MKIIVNDLKIPVEKAGIKEYLKKAAEKLKERWEKIRFIKIISKTLNISDKKQFYYILTIVVSIPALKSRRKKFAIYREEKPKVFNRVTRKERPIIVGFGPAGIFAALRLIDYGLKPVIFERGKKLEDRSLDVNRFIGKGILNEESNIQFGEGGAGAYSDGKIFSRINNSKYVRDVLNTFVRFGAPEEILYIQKPHLGTDVVCKVVKNMRRFILENGGEINYSSKLTDLIIKDSNASGVIINDKKEYRSDLIFLAPGHSARDTFEMLERNNVLMEQKPVSIGLRIEHPKEVVNLMRYGEKYKDFSGIGAAAYSLNFTDRKNGKCVNTFCMCPGGEVINASSEKGFLVLNGMSYSKRDSNFSNSALVVSCKTSDYKKSGSLAGIEFQKEIEKKAFEISGRWEIPAQNLEDFMRGKISNVLNKSSCKFKTVSCDLSSILPDFVVETLRNGFENWREEYPLFVSGQALLMAPETRTSCPLRIRRNQKFESENIKNLFPIGEGSGYSGGITSSAQDALKAVDESVGFNKVV